MLRSLIVAAVLALSPFAAAALTVGSGSNISNGGSYDLGSGPFFWDATFTGSDGPGSVSFTFSNTTLSPKRFGVAQGTVLQFSGSFNGLTLAWANGQSQSVASGTNAILDVSTLLVQGATDTLTLSWGDVTGAKTNVDLDIAAVPLPASGLILVAGLLGLGAVRRRSRKATA